MSKFRADGTMQRTEKQILSEKESEKLSLKLNQIVKGMYLTVIYFQGDTTEQGSSPFGFYQALSEKVEKVDAIGKTIKINGIIVKFEDILDVV